MGDRVGSLVSPPSRILKQSACLTCSFGLSRLCGLARFFGSVVSLDQATQHIDQTDRMDQTDCKLAVRNAESLNEGMSRCYLD